MEATHGILLGEWSIHKRHLIVNNATQKKKSSSWLRKGPAPPSARALRTCCNIPGFSCMTLAGAEGLSFVPNPLHPWVAIFVIMNLICGF